MNDESLDGRKEPSIREITSSFAYDVDALLQMLHASMYLVAAAEANQELAYKAFGEKHGTRIGPDSNGGYRFGRDYAMRALMLHQRRDRAARGYTLVPRSFVVSLVSSFDAHVGNLLSSIYRKRPEQLDSSDRSLSLAELKSLGSIDAAIESMLEKEIESLLRQSHSDQFTSMEQRFKIKLREGLDSWPRFIELTQRRNCFVHNGGRASDQYFRTCRLHKVDLDPKIKSGDILGVSPEYFDRAHHCIFEIGLKLSHVLWRKMFPEDREEADQSLTNIIYGLLSEGRWELARNLSDFSCETIKTYSNEQGRLRFLINRAQAYKWSGQTDKCNEILSSVDWSACSDDFNIAQQVLHNNFDMALETMRRIGADGTIKAEDYADWPLFKEFRMLPGFLMVFENIFGKPFEQPEQTLSFDQAKTDTVLALFKHLWQASLGTEAEEET
jgi:hypothetical protein